MEFSCSHKKAANFMAISLEVCYCERLWDALWHVFTAVRRCWQLTAVALGGARSLYCILSLRAVKRKQKHINASYIALVILDRCCFANLFALLTLRKKWEKNHDLHVSTWNESPTWTWLNLAGFVEENSQTLTSTPTLLFLAPLVTFVNVFECLLVSLMNPILLPDDCLS